MFVRTAAEKHDSIPGVPDPAENPRLVGHARTAELLAGAYRAGKLHHALLFAGPMGIGKATLAFRLAHHLLKYPAPESAPPTIEDADPASPLFRQIANGSHPSVLHLTRPYDDKRKAFKAALTVDEIRRVNKFLSMTAHDGGYRVVIVDPADDMNTNAANALLKNLEEPPSRTAFFLTSHSPGNLLTTIRSRCQLHRFAPLVRDELVDVLRTLEVALPDDPEALETLVERAEGSARAAVLLTEFGGLEIGAALEGVLQEQAFDVAAAHRLGEAVSGRDQSIQFGLFNNAALDRVAAVASAAAARGELKRAGRLSELWTEAGRRVAETETYNLDRKQHVVGLLARLHEELR